MNGALFTWLHEGAGNQPVLDFLSVMAAVVALGLLVNQLITVFYFHPRPYMMGLCKPLIPHASGTSFPSDNYENTKVI